MPHTNGYNAASSSKLRRIYDALPVEAQKKLVDDQLSALLSYLPAEKAKRVVSAANRLQKQYASIPKLDLKGKKKEIRLLLSDLRRDTKCGFLKERSNRSEILSEIIESLVSWFGDIWKVVYERQAYFAEAHACLLYAWEVITELSNNPGFGGCHCSVINLPMLVVIKSSTGKVIRRFSYSDPQNTDRVLLWIWRELFVSMYAVHGSQRAKKRIPEMLLDIEDCMQWSALERLLHGGNKVDDDEDDWSDEDDIGEDEDSESLDFSDADSYISISDLQANHWPKKLNKVRHRLLDLVLERLQTLFKVNPSLGLYNAITSLAPDFDDASEELLESLAGIATGSSMAFAAAMDIYTTVDEPDCIDDLAALLEEHSHLIRPQDSHSYQEAVLKLSGSSAYPARAVEILEAELKDTVHTIRLQIQACFKGLDDAANKAELERLLRLSQGSQNRVDRIESWVDSVITPSTGPFHPVAFAAMMMGFPTGALEDGEDGDFMALMDLDPSDPDLVDLREEHQPRLRERFEGWTEVAIGMGKEGNVLTKLYSEMVEDMPYLKAKDIADDMTSRLRDRPSKAHVGDALDSLAEFAALQRERISVRAEKKRLKQMMKPAGNANAAQGTTANSNSNSSSNQGAGAGASGDTGGGSASERPNGQPPRTGFTFSFSAGHILSSSTVAPPSTFGGLDDID